jgi:GTP cyclohydrolase I
MNKTVLTYQFVRERLRVVDRLGVRVFGIPRGGHEVVKMLAYATVVDHVSQADIIIDDIVDSGKTRDEWMAKAPGKEFFAIIDKQSDPKDAALGWVIFPWEKERGEDAPHDAVRRMLQFIGEDPDRAGLRGTPDRVCRALAEMCAGYAMDPAAILAKRFACSHDDLVIVRDLHFTSLCEHHLMPFAGKVSIGYIPSAEVVGLSKLPRLVDCFAHRLQLQEQLTTQIADAIELHLRPKGLGVVVEATHGCMSCRGVRRHESSTITSAVRGLLRTQPAARAEFMSLLQTRSPSL